VNQAFIPGLELSQLLYEESVRPILDGKFTGLVHSAGLLGPGSDVLGFDTPQSTDHDWGPRLILFLRKGDHESKRDPIEQALRRELPVEVRGYPTNLGRHEDGTAVMVRVGGGPIDHGVTIHTVRGWMTDVLGFDPTGEIRPADWVSVPENRLLIVTAGRVFHDGLATLEPLRRKLRYYPTDVWLYLMSAQWRRIAQEEPFMARCGQAGDELGSRLIAGRLVQYLVRLCCLMERRYAPYVKWLGSAFSRLDCASDLAPLLTRVLEADSWEERQTWLTAAYELAARMHNALGITDPLPAEVSPFHRRPFMVIRADRFANAIRAVIRNPEVLALPEHLGGWDQVVDSTDALGYWARFRGVWAGG